jgi:hypothetical protein
MISLTRHWYHRALSAGDKFDAEDGHVALLRGLGRAELAEPESEDAPYITRDMTAEKPAAYRRKAAS